MNKKFDERIRKSKEILSAAIMKAKYKCKYCGTLYLKKDKVPTCCQKALNSEGNSALIKLEY